jgi:hypothetical protein
MVREPAEDVLEVSERTDVVVLTGAGEGVEDRRPPAATIAPEEGPVAAAEGVKGIDDVTSVYDPLTPWSSLVEASGFQGATTAYYAFCIKAAPTTRVPLHGAPGTVDAFGAYWFYGGATSTRDNHIMLPKTWSRTSSQTDGAYTASSRHGAVVNVLLADGSTRAIKQTIAVQLWWKLGPRAGGEVVSTDAY